MSGKVFTTNPEILAKGDYGSENNTCIWRCLIAAIIGTIVGKFDDKTFDYYMKIFKYTAKKMDIEFPKIGDDVDILEVYALLERIADIFNFSLQVLQCDNIMSILFFDSGIKIGSGVNKYYLCLYMRHFYLLKIDDLAQITEEQMNAIQTAEILEDFDQIEKLQSDIFTAHLDKLAKKN